MSAKQLLVVIGASGLQGGSVINTILSDAKTAALYNIRAVTRDSTKPNAQALAGRGVEVVNANLNDKDSLKEVFKGASSVFAVTDFWSIGSAEAEFQQGKNIADAAKESGVQHLVWSSLLDVTKLTNGALSKVTHFDSKARVEAYIRSQSVPASFFLPGFYITNLAFRPSQDGANLTLALPMSSDSPIPILATAADTGKFVKGILLHKEATLGKRVLGATDYYTPKQLVEGFEKVKPKSGKGVTFTELPGPVFKSILMNMAGKSEEVAEELYQNMRLMPEYGYYGGESLEWSHSILDEPLTTWEGFVATAPAFEDLE